MIPKQEFKKNLLPPRPGKPPLKIIKNNAQRINIDTLNSASHLPDLSPITAGSNQENSNGDHAENSDRNIKRKRSMNDKQLESNNKLTEKLIENKKLKLRNQRKSKIEKMQQHRMIFTPKSKWNSSILLKNNDTCMQNY